MQRHLPAWFPAATALGMLVCVGLRPAAAASDPWTEGDGFRYRPLPVTAPHPPGLTRLSPATTGVTFSNHVSQARSIDNRNLLSGSGVALADVDGDGWCDIYFCGVDPANALYRNLGDWRFEDITAQSGVACEGQDSTGALFGDLDGDGDQDLLVNSFGHGVRMFANDGHGRFTEVTDQAGIGSRSGGTSMALADVDGDGDLDLYVVNYRTTTIMDRVQTKFQVVRVDGRYVVATVDGVPATDPALTNRFVVTPSGSILELAEPDLLFLNDGHGRFTAASWTDGTFRDEQGRPLTAPPQDWGLSVQFHDINGDLAPDFYVCNDLFSPDRFWVNDGHGHFRAIDPVAVRTTSTFSMGIDFGDLNRDGAVDFVVADMLGVTHKSRHTQVSTEPPARWPIGMIDNRPQAWRNTLQLNRGDATFAEIAHYAGVEASDWSWMPLLIDLDLDGYLDLLIPNGQLLDVQNVDMQRRIDAERARRQLTSADIRRMVAMFPDFRTPNLVYRNRGDLTFENMGDRWGFAESGMTQGTATADLDHDGDLDLVANNLNETAALYRNDTGAPRLAVRLRGPRGNPDGIGAKVTVTGGPVEQTQEVIAGGHYLSHSEPRLMFAAGAATNRLRVEVIWRDGARSVVPEVSANCLVEIEHPGRPGSPPAPPFEPEPWFADATDLLAGHRHHEDPFDDFSRQPLLLRRLSQLGPGIAWHDVDGDGWEDLVIGTGRGGAPAVFRNEGRDKLRRLENPVLDRPAPRDTTAVLGLGSTLLFGAANWEDGSTNGGCLQIIDVARRASGVSVLGPTFSTGPLAMADVNGDGALDLFIGGRAVAGRYPEPADSLLLLNERGRLRPVQRFEKLGLVSAALFTDLDADGQAELVCACDWGPVRVFRWKGARFEEETARWGLEGLTGWWNSVAAGDFDEDGRMDLAAGNWGLNSRFGRPSAEHPMVLLYGDLDESGVVQLIHARYKEELGGLGPETSYLIVSRAMPFLVETVPTFEAYATHTIEQIYGDWLQAARRLEAATFASMVFLNRGDHFEPRPLPPEAQWSPAFGLCVGDLDGDGHEDLFLAQNFFALAPGESRQDAGRSLLLRGDGRGGFQPVPGQRSGLKVYGEQRGAALADFDHDGRLDLAVTQNGAATRLFRNQQARPGLRVRLLGGPGNPFAIGAVLRLTAPGWSGPARELHAGSGYWSCDSPVTILTWPETVAADRLTLEIRWPGGGRTQTPVPAGTQEMAVDARGRLAPAGR